MARKKRSAIVGAIVLSMTVLAVPASAAPTDPFSFEYPVDCDGTEIWAFYEEWTQEFTLDNQVLQIGHTNVRYTFEDNTFTFVEAYVDRSYYDHNGDHISTRRGRVFSGFRGYNLLNDTTFEVVQHGLQSPDADDQACAALVG
jgi:hypothetical protein